MTKTDLIFLTFLLRFVDFAVQFRFLCKFPISFHEKRQLDSNVTVAWFSWTNHNSLLCIAANEIALFCTDNRLRQMAFFLFAKVGKGEAKAGFRVMLKYFEIKKGFSLSYKTNRFHVAVSLFSNRPQKTSKCGKNISYTLGYAPWATWKHSPRLVFPQHYN